MAVVAFFDVEGADSTKYEEVIRRLTEMGLKDPDGQIVHLSYGDTNRLQVIEVFESQDKLNAFGAKLMPILKEVGIEAKPTVFDVYKIITK